MDPEQQVEHVIDDCFFAVGQALGRDKRVDYDAIVWWRTRYRALFLNAIVDQGNSWLQDRDRLNRVGQFLGERAAWHTGARTTVDLKAAMAASAEVEAGCRMNARREGLPA